MTSKGERRRLAERADQGDAGAAAALRQEMVESVKRKIKRKSFKGRDRIGLVGPTEVVNSAVRRHLESVQKRVESGEKAEPIHDLEAVLLTLSKQRVLEEVRKFGTQKRNRAREQGGDLILNGLEGCGPTPSAAAAARDVERRVAAAVANLGDIDRAVIIGRLYDEKSWAELAATLGTTPYFVKIWYARALGNLRTALGEDL